MEAKRIRRYYTVKDIKEILGIGQCKAYELANYFAARGLAIRIGSTIRISMKKFDDWLVAMEEGRETLDIAAMPMEEIREMGRRDSNVPKRAERKRRGVPEALQESVIERVRSIGSEFDPWHDGEMRSMAEWQRIEAAEKEAERRVAKRAR
jgi:hypothetical protein